MCDLTKYFNRGGRTIYKVTHNTEDDPAGFLAICIVTTFVAIVVATAVAVFEKLLQNAIDMKSENDLTV